jgi:hypothetical protein
MCWFSLRVESPARSTAEMWTNTSFSPTAGLMNPYPLVGLNHLTLPLCIAIACLQVWAGHKKDAATFPTCHATNGLPGSC